jgi:hypothetical protein
LILWRLTFWRYFGFKPISRLDWARCCWSSEAIPFNLDIWLMAVCGAAGTSSAKVTMAGEESEMVA